MTLHGIDVSHYQDGLKLANTDAQFALFKTTQGVHTDDPAAAGFINQARKTGLPFGLYHFIDTSDATAEADHFIARVKALGALGEAVLALDWEADGATTVARAKTFLDRVYAKTGIRALIYMSQSVTTAHDWTPVAAHHQLWVARYNDTIGPTGAWGSALMWQYTSSHKTGGKTVDADRFYGDKTTWHTLAKPTSNTSGGDMSSSGKSGVWDDELYKWQPGQDSGSTDTMPAGQQMNQARGYAYDADQQAKKIKSALKALAQAQDDKTRKAMLDALD